jgi:hypothetical protein
MMKEAPLFEEYGKGMINGIQNDDQMALQKYLNTNI